MSAAFETIKSSVDIVDAAQRYGLQVVRGGKAHCPWHTDKTPSLSFYKNNSRFHCFSCGTGGDIIDLVGLLLNISPEDTLRELNSAYHLGLDLDKPESPEAVRNAIRQRRIRQKQAEIFSQWEKGSFLILNSYFHTLKEWKKTYVPTNPAQPIHPRFLEALNRLDYVEYLLNAVYINGTKEDKAAFFRSHEKLIRAIEQQLIKEGLPYAHEDGANTGAAAKPWPGILQSGLRPVAVA